MWVYAIIFYRSLSDMWDYRPLYVYRAYYELRHYMWGYHNYIIFISFRGILLLSLFCYYRFIIIVVNHVILRGTIMLYFLPTFNWIISSQFCRQQTLLMRR